MRTINIQVATAELSRLVDAAADGEEIIISRSGKPIARLMPLAPAPERPRSAGTLVGDMAVGAAR
ncbi:MAG TPA: type II toxin-antitoxin system prevent-host-death family antitoxin [Stellaceae bacterium]|jgi:prevent-host-death family protein|nr:type II toxin-antitoxin system prevent-host-death family antitoxin [Stellaceae bacterium]